jgi:hypothetical protein
MTTDKTTSGVEIDPDEVEALLHNLCGFHLAERDPVQRYTVLTREQVLYDALASAIRRERGRALAELVERGHKLSEVAELTGLGTRQRVQRLIKDAAEQAVAAQAVIEVQEASRQFDERLANVEATLDEMVSGIITLPNEPAAPVGEVEDDYSQVMSKEPYVVEHHRGDLDGNGRYGRYAPRDDYVPPPPIDPLTADFDEVSGMFEPTQVMPALSAAMRPANEVEDEEPWWRRARD